MTSSRRSIVLMLLLAPTAVACAGRGGTVGEPASEDDRITIEVERLIAERDDLVPQDLSVQVTGGVVVISGVQPELEPVSDLLRRIARVRGVKEVVNRIRIQR